MTKGDKKEVNDSMNKADGHNVRLQEKLIENLVELQKVNTNMAEKFDKLSTQIAGLLGLFENAARSFATNPSNQGLEKDKEFLDKIDKLLDQNKTIAKGLTIMDEKIRERVYGGPPQQQPQKFQSSRKIEDTSDSDYESSSMNKPLPKF